MTRNKFVVSWKGVPTGVPAALACGNLATVFSWLLPVGFLLKVLPGLALTSFSVNRTIKEEKRLRDEEDEVEALLQQRIAAAAEAHQTAQQNIDEALGRLLRIRQQRKLLRNRGIDLFKRGVQSLDEMNAEDEVLVAEEQSLVGSVQLSGRLDVLDWSMLEPSFLDQVSQGAAGGTDPVTAGSSSDV